MWKLTGGDVHVTDRTNASRTLLANLRTLDWDDELLAVFGVDRSLLPRIAGSSEMVGEAELLGARIPISGIAGDQQAALFGQGCHEPGQAKATYGTGSFLLVHTGAAAGAPPHGLLATAAADGYALEGAVLVSGAAIQWLRDGLGHPGGRGRERGARRERRLDRRRRLRAGADRARLALVGSRRPRPRLGPDARHDARAPRARGARGDRPSGGRRRRRAPEPPTVLRADGGAAANGFLMQLQADLLGCPVEVAAERETTALGAAALAGRTRARVARRQALRAARRPRRHRRRRAIAWRRALQRATDRVAL